MNRLRCVVFRGLPKEVEEEVNKFLEATPVEIYRVLQSEYGASAQALFVQATAYF